MATGAQLRELLKNKAHEAVEARERKEFEAHMQEQLARIRAERCAVLGTFALLIYEATTQQDDDPEKGVALEVNRSIMVAVPEYGPGVLISRLQVLDGSEMPLSREQLGLPMRDRLIGRIVSRNIFRPVPDPESAAVPEDVGLSEEIWEAGHPTLTPHVLHEGVVATAEAAVDSLGRELSVLARDARNVELNPVLAERLPQSNLIRE
ncbi:MAG TPA: hypothetical protein VLF59_00590 [Candidatus Saccharimonadales bacterium]|nr:hypothetical protein [Candidatus Saccharimonadales bacterium]